ncbi:MAG: C-terminal binding protein [Oscillospiraceae bacterium]|nr:C-terminal binding protein [Oscillospiraceae bacterium]
MAHKIVIADCDHNDIDIEKVILSENGLDCDWRKCITEDELIKGCTDASVLIIQYAKVTRRVMEKLPDLKLVIRYGVGYDTVDVPAAMELGIEVCNVPDYGTNEVADHALAHTLCLLRKLYKTNSDIRSGEWNFISTMPIRRINCLTVGVIGFGRIGKQYAKRMEAFGAKIIAYDVREVEAPSYVSLVSFDELLSASDIISIHCPADNNLNLIGEKEFESMKDGVYLINVSRGGIIDEEALDNALSSGKVAGCGLDVALKEPLPSNHPLLRHENLTVSPHMAWYSEDSAQELKRKVALEATRFVKGESVLYSVITNSTN